VLVGNDKDTTSTSIGHVDLSPILHCFMLVLALLQANPTAGAGGSERESMAL